jgi:hypothetical protein
MKNNLIKKASRRKAREMVLRWYRDQSSDDTQCDGKDLDKLIAIIHSEIEKRDQKIFNLRQDLVGMKAMFQR